jgi:hypothetical protein
MKTLSILVLLFVSFQLSAQRIVDKGSYILYANGTGDTLSIPKDRVTIHEMSVLVYMEISGRDADIPLYPADFSFANTTLLRQYLDKMLFQPEVEVYSLDVEADTLIITTYDRLKAYAGLVDEASTDSLYVVTSLESIGNMASDTVKYAPGVSFNVGLDHGIFNYAKFMAPTGCRFTFTGIKR